VTRSRGFFSRIAGLFNRSRIDEATWDELEELLISADVGMETAEKLMGRVKRRAAEEKLVEGAHVRAVLKEEMVRLLDVPVKAQAVGMGAGMKVILMVGVNGTGKTTSIAKLAIEY